MNLSTTTVNTTANKWWSKLQPSTREILAADHFGIDNACNLNDEQIKELYQDFSSHGKYNHHKK